MKVKGCDGRYAGHSKGVIAGAESVCKLKHAALMVADKGFIQYISACAITYKIYATRRENKELK
jgi:hypothetical protein